VPSRRHYGNYPQIEDGVGMVRSFVNSFEKLLKSAANGTAAAKAAVNVRTHPVAVIPSGLSKARIRPSTITNETPIDSSAPIGPDLNGTIMTGEMFAPILREHIDAYNSIAGTKLNVLAVPNTYFGGDVSVAGLLSAQDLLAVRDQIKGEFVIIPKVTIKSDEPIFIDGVSYEELKSQFPVPVIDLDVQGLLELLSNRKGQALGLAL
jgi:NifB/MoaA-like Fe-S oxidoreductase